MEEVQSNKCRGQYEDLSEERKQEIQQLCSDEKFSGACFVLPESVLENFWEQTKDKFPPETAKQMMCSVETTVRVDRKTVRMLGMTHEQLGDALKTVMRLAMHKADLHFGGAMVFMMAKIFGGEVEMPKFETPIAKLIRGDPQWCDQGRFESTFDFNGQRLRVFVILWGGSQRCPFQPQDDKHYYGYRYGARDVVVTNLGTGETLTFSTLLPHMIKHHGFLEGPMCWYRVNPENVLKVLGPFEKGKSYKLKSHTTIKMRSSGSSGNMPHSGVKDLAAEVDVVKLRHHDVYILEEGSKILVTPVDNTEIVTETEHAGRLERFGLEDDQLREGWHDTFTLQKTKVYHWSDWLPKTEDGAQSKQVEETSGPRIMMLGGDGKVTDFGDEFPTGGSDEKE